MATVTEIDQHIQFVTSEHQNVSARPEAWAASKARKFSQLLETLRALRQEKMMTSAMTGKRIDAPTDITLPNGAVKNG